MEIRITSSISIDDSELEMQAIRAQGSGGQNVNKVSSAIHLRFAIGTSSLPQELKEKLLSLKDSRVTNDGIFVLKAQSFRTQEQNREDAVERLIAWIKAATIEQKPRRATKVSKSVKVRRGEVKKQQSAKKTLRKKVEF
ncbi:aminoacyl-tRNA hydrolase [Alteromonas sp. McT4-15]|uniref:alternative ribosome rescue aminoacyl-tRNA hydrolase ArfB n=1 Tax=unclassified Alteromonas TaxID=2614992 RepID=UPI0019230A2B|nr:MULTISPECIES: alternative ribosome rescue aminoacyl-tRNA hydrolase ArfB [unclassified Alteromonas]MCB4434825.1 aminoacyl-tRNA hydrolase [Alteromonas sp. McT4-15]BCO20863.1 aminoacyl-tRNA hydrolase [Alteromonas sp. KC3]BCO24833.1 aminoacyl-tRNA hydrolase [Alteromonas sp. KC14]